MHKCPSNRRKGDKYKWGSFSTTFFDIGRRNHSENFTALFQKDLRLSLTCFHDGRLLRISLRNKSGRLNSGIFDRLLRFSTMLSNKHFHVIENFYNDVMCEYSPQKEDSENCLKMISFLLNIKLHSIRVIPQKCKKLFFVDETKSYWKRIILNLCVYRIADSKWMN